jgi:ATP-dependent exoDNAse (exonuclease V) alpha subunit
VLLIGDTRQHQGVEAGRPFEQLQEAGMRTARLDEIVRQKDPALKSAVELLATGQVSAALDALQEQGRVKEIPGGEDRIRAIAKSYVESPDNTLIVSPDNASRRELNVAVRHDVVRYTRGSKAIGIEAAAYASVVAINPSANQLTVEKANGELATYDPRRLTGVNVYQEIQREFSVGDRIQFTAPDKSLGVANRDMAAIEAIHPDDRLSVRFDNNRQIEFNPNEHRHLDHGYAVTSHSSQGLTAERVLVHGDTSVHPDLLNSRFAYVSISRASLDAKIYTNDTAELGQRLSGEVSKSSAIEFSHSTANAMADLSLGQGI